MSRITYWFAVGALIAYIILLLAVFALPYSAFLDRLDAGDPWAILVAIGLAVGALLLGARR